MAFTGNNQILKTDEQLGVFTGYVRRPLPNNSGMTAQFFGENGPDADIITALSLSKYQEAEVFVNVYLIKDSNGQIMKKDEKYPLISSFIGFVRRSTPKKEGMIAQFFAPNGKYADEIAKLSKSEYLDCLVFVDIRGNLAISNDAKIQEENLLNIDNNYINRLSKNEKKDFEKTQKAYKNMNKNLQFSEFLQKKEVFTKLGTETEFKEWLSNIKSCSIYFENDSDNCNNIAEVKEIEYIPKPFNFLPICPSHFSLIDDYTHFNDNKNYYEMKHHLLLKKWVLHTLSVKFSDDGNSEPNPQKVIVWASNNNVSKFLPNNYRPVIE